MKRFWSFVLSLVLLLLCVPAPAYAAELAADDLVDYDELTLALNSAEYLKPHGVLSDVDFNNIEISGRIKTYDFTDDGIKYNKDFIALKSDGALVAWAIEVKDGNNVFYQISPVYVAEVNQVTSEKTEFALIYDHDACYLYDGATLYKLGDISTEIEYRATITSIDDVTSGSQIELNNMQDASSFVYTSLPTSRTPVYYECNIKFVSQNPPSMLCWAASAACITNYKMGTTFTAENIAEKYYGSPNYNKNAGIPSAKITSLYQNTCGLAYTYQEIRVPENIIFKNIINDFPLCGSFEGKITIGGNTYVGWHDTVVYGVNLTSGYIYIMDPNSGFCTCKSTGSTYTYTSTYDNATYTLKGGACRYWAG